MGPAGKDIKVKYSKSELTYYAKKLAKLAESIFYDMCLCEEFTDHDISQDISNGDEEVINEVSKRFQKYCRIDLDSVSLCNLENGDIQRLFDIVNKMDY